MAEPIDDRPERINRRNLIAGAAVLGATGLVTAACGSPVSSSPATPSATDTSSPTDSGASPSEATSAGPTVLGPTSGVAVGGGQIFSDARVVVTQPKAGEFIGFSSRCTHQGCPVDAVQNGFISCPCHGSVFTVATGAPTPDSPAKTPLARVSVKVEGGNIVLV